MNPLFYLAVFVFFAENVIALAFTLYLVYSTLRLFIYVNGNHMNDTMNTDSLLPIVTYINVTHLTHFIHGVFLSISGAFPNYNDI